MNNSPHAKARFEGVGTANKRRLLTHHERRWCRGVAWTGQQRNRWVVSAVLLPLPLPLRLLLLLLVLSLPLLLLLLLLLSWLLLLLLQDAVAVTIAVPMLEPVPDC